MANYCGDCEKLDKNDYRSWENDYYCPETRKYKKLNDRACDRFIPKREGGYTPSGCPTTTILCTILGYSDDCDILRKFRFVRENYLKNTVDGINLLQEYDLIGPIISEQLRKSSLVDAILISKSYILPCYDAIVKKDYDKAIEFYKSMISYLKQRFMWNIENTTNNSFITPYDELGKARIKKRPVNA